MKLAQITDITPPAGLRFTSTQNLPSYLTAAILRYAIIGAGLFFFVRLVTAGFTYMTSVGDPGKIQSATKEITHALVGLLVVITTFFIAQILQVTLGLNFL